MAKYKITYSKVSIREMIIDSDLDLSGETDLRSLLSSEDILITDSTEVDGHFKNDIIVQLIPDEDVWLVNVADWRSAANPPILGTGTRIALSMEPSQYGGTARNR